MSLQFIKIIMQAGLPHRLPNIFLLSIDFRETFIIVDIRSSVKRLVTVVDRHYQLSFTNIYYLLLWSNILLIVRNNFINDLLSPSIRSQLPSERNYCLPIIINEYFLLIIYYHCCLPIIDYHYRILMFTIIVNYVTLLLITDNNRRLSFIIVNHCKMLPLFMICDYQLRVIIVYYHR